MTDRTFSDSTRVDGLLDLAMAQRAPLFLSFADGVTSIKSLKSVITNLEGGSLLVEPAGLGGAAPRWQGQEVVCYFSLVSSKNARQREVFFNFRSTIERVDVLPTGLVLRLGKPKAISTGQRRSSIRVNPDPALILGASLWPEDKFLRKDPDTGKTKLHKPKIPAEMFRSFQAVIKDISSGGMRLLVKGESIASGHMEFKKGERYILWLVLLDPDKEEKITLWIKSRVNHTRQDPQEKDMEMGIEFQAEGTIREDGILQWKNVRDNNVMPLSRWTQQRHMELVRRGLVG